MQQLRREVTSATKIQQLTYIERLIVEFLAVSLATTTEKRNEGQEQGQGGEADRTDRVVIDWKPLAYQIRMESKDVEALWEHMGEARRAELWQLAIQHRVETAVALPVMQEGTKQRVVNKAIQKLESMLDAGMIRDVSELLSVARYLGGAPANPNAPVQNNTYNIGGSAMRIGAGETLPSGKDVFILDLSPKTAQNIQNNDPQATTRTIDHQMLPVDALRTLVQPK